MQIIFIYNKEDTGGCMYTDEQILKMKKKIEQQIQQREKEENLEEEINQSIFDGKVKILGKEVVFERREIPEFGISILMPKDFEELDADLRKLVYPSSNGPQHVYTSEDEYMNISFKKNSNIVKKEQLKEFVNLSRKIMEVSGPKVKIVKTGEIKNEDMTIGTMEFISNALDGVIYNYMGFVLLETGVLLISIVYKNARKKRFNPLAREILQSVIGSAQEEDT